MIPAWVSLLDALIAIALLVFGILAAHFEAISAFAGFQLFLLGFFLGILALIAGVIALIRTAHPSRSGGRPRAIAGTVIGLVITVPIAVIIARNLNYPNINDITTDFDTPPEFVHAATLEANQARDMHYLKAKSETVQQSFYGNLEPIRVATPPNVTFDHVKIAAAEMPNWRITYADPRQMTIEGVATSTLFHFKDDFVVQVRPAEGGASLIEMRSKSRDGLSDLGANTRRIHAFFVFFSHGNAVVPAPKTALSKAG
ncbi:MAG: DUF1499 domain-containing protein [Candidatus Binataceae bacterium]